MSRHFKSLLFLSIVIALMPFLGFPRGATDVVIVVSALLIALIAYAHGKKKRAKQQPLELEKKDPHAAFSESKPGEDEEKKEEKAKDAPIGDTPEAEPQKDKQQ